MERSDVAIQSPETRPSSILSAASRLCMASLMLAMTFVGEPAQLCLDRFAGIGDEGSAARRPGRGGLRL